MRKILLSLIASAAAYGVIAQDVSDYGRISINAVQPSYDNIPAEASQYLENRLRRLITLHGMTDNGLSERFVLTAKINIISKDIVPTTPSRVSQKMEVTLYIGDVVENKVYNSVSVSLAGIGTNETKSFISAFQNLPINTPAVKTFVEEAKDRIGTYYTENCQAILTEANRLAQNQHYDAAIYKLVAVPNVCSECFEKCQAAAQKIYTQKINAEGTLLLQQARNKWVAKKDYPSAEGALAILSQINVQAACLPQADKLIGEIDSKLCADEQREWEFKVRQYEDNLAMERQKQKDRTALLSATISAVQHIGTAFGKNQPQTINKTQIIKSW